MVINLLFQLSKDITDVCASDKTDHNVQFLQLDIDGIIVFHKKYLDIFLQNVSPVRVYSLSQNC